MDGPNLTERKQFRFLTAEEFQVLPVQERADYLVRAQQELDERQRLIREQMQLLAKDVR
jgi:hypothetical protein